VNLHQETESRLESRSLWDGENLKTENVAEVSQCGFINIDSVQQVVAAKWAIDVINNQSLPNELKIGRNLKIKHASHEHENNEISGSIPFTCISFPID